MGGGGITDDEDQTGDGELYGVPEGSPDWLKFIPQQGNKHIYDVIMSSQNEMNSMKSYGFSYSQNYDYSYLICNSNFKVYIIKINNRYPTFYEIGDIKNVFGNGIVFYFKYWRLGGVASYESDFKISYFINNNFVTISKNLNTVLNINGYDAYGLNKTILGL